MKTKKNEERREQKYCDESQIYMRSDSPKLKTKNFFTAKLARCWWFPFDAHKSNQIMPKQIVFFPFARYFFFFFVLRFVLFH